MFNQMLDTGILYDYFVNNPDTQKALNLNLEGFFISQAAFFELGVLILARTNSVEYVQNVLEIILKYPDYYKILSVTPETYQSALTIMSKYQDQKLSWIDCLQIAQSETYNCKLLTKETAMTRYQTGNVIKPY